MKYQKLFILMLIVTGGILTCAKKEPPPGTPITPTEKVMLFNGQNLTGWVFACRDSLITDVSHTWSVRNNVIHCTGDPFGYIRTNQLYQNYQLHVEWRWATERVPENANRNSGFLLHVDNSNRVWPPFFECQLKSGNAGDLVLLGGMECKELLELREQMIKEAGDDTEKLERAKRTVVIPRRNESGEKPIGEWNTADITMQNNTAIVKDHSIPTMKIVNNLIKVMVLYGAVRPAKNHKTRLVSRFYGYLSNKLGRQMIIKITGLHQKDFLFIHEVQNNIDYYGYQKTQKK